MDPLPPPSLPPPERHGCLTAWLVFILVVNTLRALLLPWATGFLNRYGHVLHYTPITTGTLVLCSIANIVFAIALFYWQKWGFYGFVAVGVVAVFANLAIGVNVVQALTGLLGVGILYGVLNINNPRSAWARLK